jgi:hypothetical protein
MDRKLFRHLKFKLRSLQKMTTRGSKNNGRIFKQDQKRNKLMSFLELACVEKA